MTRTVAVAATRTEMTQIVMPEHANNLGNAFGGQIAAWIDICAAVSAQRLARAPAVTASMDSLHFRRPVRQGMVLVLQSHVNRVWRSSMEVGVRVEAEHPATGVREHCCSAYLTFVVVDLGGQPVQAPNLDIGEDPEAARRWEQAEIRRNARLDLRRLRREEGGTAR